MALETTQPNQKQTNTTELVFPSTPITALSPDVLAIHILPRLNIQDLFQFSGTCKYFASVCEIEFKRQFIKRKKSKYPSFAFYYNYRSALSDYLGTHKELSDFCTKCLTCHPGSQALKCNQCLHRCCTSCSKVGHCDSCSQDLCDGCYLVQICKYCDIARCIACSPGDADMTCFLCRQQVCDDCYQRIRLCRVCSRTFCFDCDPVYECDVCERTACQTCSNDIMSCYYCSHELCVTCGTMDTCESCGRTSCRKNCNYVKLVNGTRMLCKRCAASA